MVQIKIVMQMLSLICCLWFICRKKDRGPVLTFSYVALDKVMFFLSVWYTLTYSVHFTEKMSKWHFNVCFSFTKNKCSSVLSLEEKKKKATNNIISNPWISVPSLAAESLMSEGGVARCLQGEDCLIHLLLYLERESSKDFTEDRMSKEDFG